MNNLSKPVRWLLAGILLMAVMAGLAWLLIQSLPHHHGIMIDDMDMSDSALGFVIAGVVMVVVGVILTVVFAGVGLLLAGVFALVVGGLAIAAVIALLPVLLFLAIPFLALYGLIRLATRPRAQVQVQTVN